MKITCINGSARNNGSCNYLIDCFIKGITEKNSEIVKYSSATPTFNFARAVKNVT